MEKILCGIIYSRFIYGIIFNLYKLKVEVVPLLAFVHIPAQPEHSFWFNVNTYSGRS